jgi:hypothetical protein
MDKKYLKWTGLLSVGLFILAIIIAIIYILLPTILGVIFNSPTSPCDQPTGGSTLTYAMSDLCGTSQSFLGVAALLIVVVSGFVSTIFTILTLIDIVTNQNLENKALWAIGILILGFFVGVAYYFMIKRKN